MWFKMHRRKSSSGGGGGGASVRQVVSTPLKVAAKSSKKLSMRRFQWPSLRRSVPLQRHKLCPPTGTPIRRLPLPPPPSTATVVEPPPRRIRCGTTVIPIMRASALHLPPLPQPPPPSTAMKRRPSTTSFLEDHSLKVRRLDDDRLDRRGRRRRQRCLDHFNPVYDDVYSAESEMEDEEAIYEEIVPPRKQRALMLAVVPSGSYLDLMQVSAMVTDSPVKAPKSNSPAPSQAIYALHGGDWISITSGVYDDVASSSGGESEAEFDPDAGIYGWTSNGGTQNIPWPTAAYGGSAFTSFPWMHQQSFMLQ